MKTPVLALAQVLCLVRMTVNPYQTPAIFCVCVFVKLTLLLSVRR